MKILACADIHLGRIPATPRTTSLSNSSAWESVVTTAIKEKVDVIAIAGDVIDQDEAWFEAFGPLLKQVKRLDDHGISIVTVAGNHDHRVFPRLGEEGASIHILGLGGTWESIDLDGIRFIGWSFPSSTYSADPFASFDKRLLDFSGPVLGLLHCNIDGQVGNDRYAPVPSNRFSTHSKAFWVLGHIHKSHLDNEYLYCGSPMALDSGECGRHGVWILESNKSSWAKPRFIQLCTYRFENCEIKLDNETAHDNLTAYIQKDLKEYSNEIAKEQFSGKLYCKLTFTGTISPGFNLQQSLNGDQLDAWEFPEVNGIEISPLPDYEDLTILELDLEELSKGIGPKALLAQKLIDVDSSEDLINQTESMIKESINARAFSLVQELDVSEDSIDTALLIRRAGMLLLRRMVSQGE